jgi:hypothetical protein
MRHLVIVLLEFRGQGVVSFCAIVIKGSQGKSYEENT